MGTILTSTFLKFNLKGLIDLSTPIKISRISTVEDRIKQLQNKRENVINLLRYNQVVYKK